MALLWALFLAAAALRSPAAFALDRPSLGGAYSKILGKVRSLGGKHGALAPAPWSASALVPSRMDFHSHSYCSDGSKTPETLAREAREAGLRYWALSDHDTAACLERAAAAAKKEGISFVAASEISAEDDSVHILALGIDPSASEMQELYRSQSAVRAARLKTIVEKLKAQNVAIDFQMDVCLPKINRERAADGLEPLSADQARSLGVEKLMAMARGQFTRPDIAAALVSKGYAASYGAAFGRYLGEGAPAYVPMAGPNSLDVIRRIHAAGGLAVLAHPYTIFKFRQPPYPFAGGSYASFEEYARALLDAGLDGVEVFRPQGAKDAGRIGAIIASYQASSHRAVLETPGSDYHGGDGAAGAQALGHIMITRGFRRAVLRALHLRGN